MMIVEVRPLSAVLAALAWLGLLLMWQPRDYDTRADEPGAQAGSRQIATQDPILTAVRTADRKVREDTGPRELDQRAAAITV